MESQKPTENPQPEETSQSDVPSKLVYFDLTEEMKEAAQKIIDADGKAVTDFWYQKHEKDAKKSWDIFYKNNKTNFFKDRHYIDREFTELSQAKDSNENYIFCELGCGVGNAFLPLVENYKNFKFYGFDFSPRAVQMIRETEVYSKNKDRIFVEPADLVLDPIPEYFEKPDFATLIFVLSAIAPEHYPNVLDKIAKYMKPGTLLLFRDYGRYDMAQLKFASQKTAKLKDNFYVKSDGTRVYYFAKEELAELFKNAGFEVIENEYHQRVVENKKEELKMHRVWLQAKFRKLA